MLCSIFSSHLHYLLRIQIASVYIVRDDVIKPRSFAPAESHSQHLNAAAFLLVHLRLSRHPVIKKDNKRKHWTHCERYVCGQFLFLRFISSLINILFCYFQRITCTVNNVEQKRLLMDLDVSMRSGSCPYTVTFYGALFREVCRSTIRIGVWGRLMWGTV